MKFVRLEQLLGVSSILDSSNQELWEGLRRLKDQSVEEGPDLDFKKEWYEGKDQSAEVAKDCIAMANNRGGVIVCGIGENSQGEAETWAPFERPDKPSEWVAQSLAAKSAPKVPNAQVRVVDDPDGSSTCVVVLAVPRSPYAPHALTKERERLYYPIRWATTTDYLQENEVAERYRARFALAHTREERGSELLRSIEGSFDRTRGLWISISLVPGVLAAGELSSDAVGAIDEATRRWEYLRLPLDDADMLDRGYLTPYVRRRRVVMSDAYDSSLSRLNHQELYLDGSAVVASRIGRVVNSAVRITQTQVELSILNLLDRLVGHAEQRGASGDAICMARLYGGRLGSEGTEEKEAKKFGVAPTAISGRDQMRPRNSFAQLPGPNFETAEWTCPLDVVGENVRELIATSRNLSLDVLSDFGFADSDALTRDGELKRASLDPKLLRDHYQEWINIRQVPMS